MKSRGTKEGLHSRENVTPSQKDSGTHTSQYCSVKEEGGIVFAFAIRKHRRAEIEIFLTLKPSSKPLTKRVKEPMTLMLMLRLKLNLFSRERPTNLVENVAKLSKQPST